MVALLPRKRARDPECNLAGKFYPKLVDPGKR